MNIVAVKTVNKFDWGKAIASSVLIFVLLLVLVAVGVVVILTLLGPAIGSVFSDLITELGTPVP